jgi:hypothetical protein
MADPMLRELRVRLKALELAAEREELERLERVVAGWPSVVEQGGTRWLDELPGADDASSLAVLRAAASSV